MRLTTSTLSVYPSHPFEKVDSEETPLKTVPPTRNEANMMRILRIEKRKNKSSVADKISTNEASTVGSDHVTESVTSETQTENNVTDPISDDIPITNPSPEDKFLSSSTQTTQRRKVFTSRIAHSTNSRAAKANRHNSIREIKLGEGEIIVWDDLRDCLHPYATPRELHKVLYSVFFCVVEFV